jgi:putative transferase (TIGR04331 family)
VRTFLATTALEEFWDTSKSILFLGEWCRLYSRKSIWSKFDAEVLASPYQQGKLTEAQTYTVELYEKLLPKIANWLDHIHNTRHSLRYWRIVVGPFLFWYIQTLYDRFLHLKAAYSLHPSLDTIGLDSSSYITPVNSKEFVELSLESDAWNHQLYTQILCLSFKPPSSYRTYSWDKESKQRDIFLKLYKISNHKFKKIKRSILRVLAQWRSFELIGMCMGGFSKHSRWHLLLKSAARILPLESCEDLEQAAFKKNDTDSSTREEIANLLAVDDFSHLVLKTLKINMPLRFIENYREEFARLDKCFPYNPRVIFSSIDWLYNDQFKMWAAKKAEQRAKLIGVQHGGNYGIRKFPGIELLERGSSDAFISWGWTDNSNVIPAPSPYLCQEIEKAKRKKKKNFFLWVSTTNSRYNCYLDSTPTPGQWLEYFDWQYRFANSLTSNTFSNLTMRLYPASSPWSEKSRIKDNLPALKTYTPQHKHDFIDQLCETELLIVDNLNTTYLYGFTLNVPTILFWDKTLWEIRDQALPYFEALYRVGIYHDTPESAAAMVDKIAHDPDEWWNKKEIQAVREQFCENFARVTPGWINDWNSALLNLLKSESRK